MRFITLICFIVISFNYLSQFTFDKRFNNEIFLNGPFNSINNKNHFILYGYAGDDTLKPFFMSIDLFGNQLNYKSYNNDACQTYVHGYVKTKDGNFIGVGSSNTAGDTCGINIADSIYSQRFRYYMHKVNKNGELIWKKNYGDTSYLHNNFGGMHIIQSNTDDNYLVFGVQYGKIAIMKINEDGDTLFIKNYPIIADYRCFIFESVADGYMCYMTNEFTSISQVLKLDNSLEQVWSKFYQYISFRNNNKTKNGGHIFATNTGNGVNKKTRLTKMDVTGDLLWQQTYHGITGHYAITELEDKNFIIAWHDIAKVDSLGNILWQKRLIPTSVDMFMFYRNVFETDDGGLFFTGRTKDFRIIATKTDCEGNLIWDTRACPTYSTTDLFEIYPNPIGDEFTIAVPATLSEQQLEIEISDTAGKVVQKLAFSKEKSVSINASSLSRGLYFYRIKNEQTHLQSGKLLK